MLANGGATSMLDVRQAEQLVFTAAETIPIWSAALSSKKFHQHTSGKQPRSHCARSKVDGATACTRGSGGASLHLAGTATGHSPGRSTIDRGQRSNWSSEKAAYFPQIALTANSGFQSSALTSLFTGPAGLWSFGGSLVQPIFAGGEFVPV